MICYLVSPCPKCGSPKTGQLRIRPWANADTMQLNANRHGELVEYVDELDGDNAFCSDCGATWEEEPERRWLSSTEIRLEKEKRGIPEETKEKKTLFRRLITGFFGV